MVDPGFRFPPPADRCGTFDRTRRVPLHEAIHAGMAHCPADFAWRPDFAGLDDRALHVGLEDSDAGGGALRGRETGALPDGERPAGEPERPVTPAPRRRDPIPTSSYSPKSTTGGSRSCRRSSRPIRTRSSNLSQTPTASHSILGCRLRRARSATSWRTTFRRY